MQSSVNMCLPYAYSLTGSTRRQPILTVSGNWIHTTEASIPFFFRCKSRNRTFLAYSSLFVLLWYPERSGYSWFARSQRHFARGYDRGCINAAITGRIDTSCSMFVAGSINRPVGPFSSSRSRTLPTAPPPPSRLFLFLAMLERCYFADNYCCHGLRSGSR